MSSPLQADDNDDVMILAVFKNEEKSYQTKYINDVESLYRNRDEGDASVNLKSQMNERKIKLPFPEKLKNENQKHLKENNIVLNPYKVSKL